MEKYLLIFFLFWTSGPYHCRLKLDWPVGYKVFFEVARGLAYLHEEYRIRIVHRDIKPNNILLDKHLNPKIVDLGLAKLYEAKKTHINTRVAGTMYDNIYPFLFLT